LYFLSLAILFECVHTIYSIYPKSELLEKAAKCIGKFVLSPKINLKYLGKVIGSYDENWRESF
jgi:AP-4 complex subunit epsilon-1